MDDQRKLAENLLSEIPEAKGYGVVEPGPGDVKDHIKIQKDAGNTEEAVTITIPLSYTYLQDMANFQEFPKEQVKKLIGDAIKRAEQKR